MEKTPRLIDIAKLADVSIGTVDRVLHNRGRVAEKTKGKVLKIAADLGYKPNIFASALAATRTSKKIFTILPKPGIDPYWDLVHFGFEKAREQLSSSNISFETYFFDLFDPEDFEEKIDEIVERPDGIVVAPIFLSKNTKMMQRFAELKVPYVTVNTLIGSESNYLLSYVGPDSFQSGKLAGRLLAIHCSPKDKVMMIPLEKDFKNAHHMLEKERGFREAFAAIAPRVDVVTCEFEDYDDPEKLGAFLANNLNQLEGLSGIYTSASRISMIAAYFKKSGIDHVKLVGYDSLPENLHYLQTGQIDYLINQNPSLMGYLGTMNICNYLIYKIKPIKLQYLPLDVLLPENIDHHSRNYLFESNSVLKPVWSTADS